MSGSLCAYSLRASKFENLSLQVFWSSAVANGLSIQRNYSSLSERKMGGRTGFPVDSCDLCDFSFSYLFDGLFSLPLLAEESPEFYFTILELDIASETVPPLFEIF